MTVCASRYVITGSSGAEVPVLLRPIFNTRRKLMDDLAFVYRVR